MNVWQLGGLARKVATEIQRQGAEAHWSQINNTCGEIDLGGHVIITIRTIDGFKVSYRLHEKVAQRGNPADNSLIDNAKALLNQAFDTVSRREVGFGENP